MSILQPPPLSAPNIPPYQAPPFGFVPPKPLAPFGGSAPAAQPVVPFTGTAPTATPYGTFTAPDSDRAPLRRRRRTEPLDAH